MQLSLMKEHVIHTCVLPDQVTGQYWVTQVNASGYEERVISVEGIRNEWILKSNKNAVIVDHRNQKVKELALAPMAIYNLYLRKSNTTVILFSEPSTSDRRTFNKLCLPAAGRIRIGRAEGCDIQFVNPLVSSVHAELLIAEQSVSICDCGSSNGTFVNRKRVSEQSLYPGDLVYIVGLQVIIGRGFIAVNNPDGQMRCNSVRLAVFRKPLPQLCDEEEEPDEEMLPGQLFYRSPRFKREIEKAEIRIDGPPSLGTMEQTPLVLMMGPAITMGLASLCTALFTVQNVLRSDGKLMNAAPTLAMSAGMLLGTLLWPVLTRRYEISKRRGKEKARLKKYKQYLEEVRQRIWELGEHQRQLLYENAVTAEQCISRIRQRQRTLWERTRRHSDFLTVRLGLGNVPLQAELKYPEKRFSLDEDVLQDELYKLAEEPLILEQVPISLSMTEDWVIGVIGKRQQAVEAVKGMVLQLAALHSYDELRLVFVYDMKEQATWEFVKWLPHVWSTDRAVRYVAAGADDLKELTAHLEQELARQGRRAAEAEREEGAPAFVVFALDKQLAIRSEFLHAVLKHKQYRGFSVVYAVDEIKQLPKECSLVIEYGSSEAKLYDRDDVSGKHTSLRPDVLPGMDGRELAVMLANVQLDAPGASYTLPAALTFLDLFDVGKIEHLNALTRWREHDPALSLQTPIGMTAAGERFYLDLHENYHGPHGLVAGMTGSGKSEFMITFILSLAVNYHPHEVAFILIDYKGGGMADALASLPHLAGTITNLDGAAVKRSLISIQSELKRRQTVFSAASKKLGISSMDIYKYQRLVREGQVHEPMPQLFIISDEFAELKTQQPEFMEQLVSAARIGRSLGIHLILATQKPSGVVDDQIWSNSRFRVCLKVQEKADSMDVIKRPDAAELTVTGRFFVQVGFNELFELGQSAWSGAPYYPSDRLEATGECSVAVINRVGRTIRQAASGKREGLHSPFKQIDGVIAYLAATAREERIQARTLWLDPIPELILWEDVCSRHQAHLAAPAGKGRLRPVIGEVDDPANQRQLPMLFPLSEEGNAIVYGSPGSGKTTFVSTLLYALMKEHTPAEIRFYLLDFASETLRAFAQAPHVGDVVLSHEAEKVEHLFRLMVKELESRKKRFADYGGDFQSYLRSGHGQPDAVVIMIHNYAAFAELYDDKEEQVAFLAREGVKYGLYFILTAVTTSAIRYRILQHFKQLYVLQLHDSADYASVLGSTDGVFPSRSKGRGIYKTDQVYEFQIAQLHPSAEERLNYIRSFCEAYAAGWTKGSARRIPILPEAVDAAFLMKAFNPDRSCFIPVGVEKRSLETAYYRFDQAYIQLVLSQTLEEAGIVQGLAEMLSLNTEGAVWVLDPEQRLRPDEAAGYRYLGGDADWEQAVVQLFDILVHRNNTYKDEVAAGAEPPVYEQLTYVLVSLSGLNARLSEDARDKLRVLLEKGEAQYRVNVLICDRAAYVSSIAYEGWFKAQVSGKDGIWLGNGFTDQYLLHPAQITPALSQDIGEAFGYLVRNGRASLVKLVTSAAFREEGSTDEANFD
ncbi:type VII secretion protein EssC [Paenibacillus sp. y28]|uniref:type VII secretion protein EssC n=1 Tax=Paenibacillus sp. y28 TaxID=3129110 RepID=UPI0030167769